MNTPLSKKDFLALPVEDRLLVVMSDGLWYSVHKLRRLTSATEDEVYDFLRRSVDSGDVIQSDTGARSYRMPLESMKKWYDANGLKFGDKIAEFLVPARVWAGRTEIEIFDEAPRRDLCIVHFECSSKDAETVRENLKYIARVCEVSPNVYKAYCVGGDYVKSIVEKSAPTADGRVRIRYNVLRREVVDIDKEFLVHFVNFYKNYSQYLARGASETIRMFLPDENERETQMVFWTLEALEKYNEKATVPFSGYFDTVMKRWPYNLPANELGDDLAKFQRRKSKAVKELRGELGGSYNPDFTELSSKMGIDMKEFVTLEERDRVWRKLKNAGSLTWDDEKGDEKVAKSTLNNGYNVVSFQVKDYDLSHKFSSALVEAALKSGDYDSPSVILSQIDESNIDYSMLSGLNSEFVVAFAQSLKERGYGS